MDDMEDTKLKIKFSADYPKLWAQESARLIEVNQLTGIQITDALLEYDTKKIDGTYYPINRKQVYLQLVFMGNKNIPFCTLRRLIPRRKDYYDSKKGKTFKVIIDDEKEE